MNKIYIIILLTPITLFLAFVLLYSVAFRLPFEILKNENINGLSGYSGNEKKFGEYVILRGRINKMYTGATITKIYKTDSTEGFVCIGNNESYNTDPTLKTEVTSYGLFGIPMEKQKYAGCVNK
jgi:hypothetical protein